MNSEASQPSLPSRAKLFASWLQTALIIANLTWSCLCLGGYRPEAQTVSYCLGAALLVAHLLLRSGGLAQCGACFEAPDWVLAAFLGYAGLHALWLSPFSWLAWPEFLGWFQLLLVYWIVRSECSGHFHKRALLAALLLLAVVAVALGFYQRYVDPRWLMLGRTQADQFLNRASGFFGIPNSLAGFLVLLLPACFAACLRPGASLVQRFLFGYLAILLSLGFILTISRGGWLSLGLALALAPLLLGSTSFPRRLAQSFAVLLMAALAITALYVSSSSVRERLDAVVRDSGESTRPFLWKASLLLFRDAPVLGTGAASFNLAFEKYRPESCQREPQWAHNDYLNTLSDYGLLGAGLLFGGALWLAARRLKLREKSFVTSGAFHPWVRQGLILGLLAFCFQLFFDFHLKLPALGLSFAIVAALASGQNGEKIDPGTASNRPPALRRFPASLALVSALAGGAMFLLFGLPLLRAEALRYPARQRLEVRLPGFTDPTERRAFLAKTQRLFEEATRLSPSHAQSWSDLSYVLSLWSREYPEKSIEYGRQAENAARQALRRSSKAYEFWARLGIALDMQGRWEEASQSYVNASLLAPFSIVTQYYLAFHYSLKPATRDKARSLIATCLRLDPSYGPAQALQAQLASFQDTR